MDDATLDQALPRALGAQVQARRPLHGGDLSDVTRLDLADGRRVVLKTGPVAGVEARMLDALQAAGAPVPQVLWTTDTAFVMTFLPTAPATPTPAAAATLRSSDRWEKHRRAHRTRSIQHRPGNIRADFANFPPPQAGLSEGARAVGHGKVESKYSLRQKMSTATYARSPRFGVPEILESGC